MDATLKTAKEIRNKAKSSSLDILEYQDFQGQFPKFFEMLTRKDMNEEMFQKLIQILSIKSAINQQAASEFSQFGAEKFLYPQFGLPSEKDLESAKEKINHISKQS